jgi:integrase
MARPRNKPLVKDRQVSGAKAPTSGRAEYRIAKVPGLVLRVTPNGKKSWAVWLPDTERRRYRLKTLGRYPALSHGAACAKAERLKLDAHEGGRVFVSSSRALTFSDVADEYVKRHARDKRSGAEDERKIRRELVPAIGAKAAAEVVTAVIVAIINSVSDRGAGVAANRTLSLLRTIFNWGKDEGLVSNNPTAGVRMRVKEEPRKRVLSDNEIVALWIALDGKAFDPATADVIRFQLLTGARIREITDMPVSELDFTGPGANWSLPAYRSKSKIEVVRPLAPRACDLVLRRIEGRQRDGFVFSSPQDPSRALAPRSPAQAVGRAAERGLVTSGWTPHDLRRTVATRLAALGVAQAVTKYVLGHAPASNDVLASVYDQYTYLRELRDALQLWEAHLFRLIEARAIDEGQARARAA